MLNRAIYAMIFLGSSLMVYNIYGYIRYARDIQKKKDWGRERTVLYLPIFLLVMFLLGYLVVGVFGKPDLIVSGILFGGSVYVCIMYHFLRRVTNRIRENEQMEARLMAAEASNKVKSSFLSSMSHEMRTPRGRLEKISVSAQHLLSLINDVLDMSQIESNQLAIRQQEFSLSQMLELVNVLTQSQCDDSGLEYRQEVIGDIGGTYIGDPERIKQVLLCILENAVEYTPAPGTVFFTTERAPCQDDRCILRFTIRDTGIGIDESFLPRLFDSFAREDASTTSRYGGSGLGMAITKQLLDRMKGMIAVSSRKGEGSEFVVTIPLEVVKPPEAAAAEETAPPASGLDGKRVLIVEDIELNAEIVADLLELEGVESERAENGQAALDRFRECPPGYYDAILMDLRMPVMDGLEATRSIRALERPDAKAIPIIALTANTLEEDVQHSLEAGMQAHMPKPVDADQLYAVLDKLIRK